MSPKLSQKQLKRLAKYDPNYTARDTEYSQHIAKHKGLNAQRQIVTENTVRIGPPESAKNTNLTFIFPESDQQEQTYNRFAAIKNKDSYEDIENYKDSIEQVQAQPTTTISCNFVKEPALVSKSTRN